MKFFKKHIEDIFTYCFFAVLFTLAFIYANERIFADASYYLARLTHTKSIWIEHQRFVLLFSQILPFIGITLNASLATIIKLYSLNHPLFYFSIFFIARYVLKNKTAGIVLILIQLIGITHSFAVPMFELYYGAGLIVLLFALLNATIKTSYKYLFFALITAIITLSHPFGMILLGILLLFMFIKKQINYYPILIFIATCIITILYKQAHISPYEAAKTEFIYNSLLSNKWLQLFSLSYLQDLSKYYIPNYFDCILLFLLLIVFVLKQKRIRFTIAYLLILLLTILLINHTHTAFEQSRYMEQLYFPLTFVIALPLFFSINEKYKIVLLPIISLIVILRLFIIIPGMNDFKQRTAMIGSFINYAHSNNINKLVISEKIMEQKTIGPNWSLPIESMYLSALQDQTKTVTICSDIDFTENKNDSLLQRGQFLFRRWEVFSIDQINTNYFQLDSSKYIRMPEAVQYKINNTSCLK